MPMTCGDCHKDIDPQTGECECLPPITQADLDRFYSRATPCPGCGADWVKLPTGILEVTHFKWCRVLAMGDD